MNLDQIKGQEAAKRALEIAVAGGHSILFVGPMGCGKTMLKCATVALDDFFNCKVADDIEDGSLPDVIRHMDGVYDGKPAPYVATATTGHALPIKLLDRFPIVVELRTVSAADLLLPCPTETSAVVGARIAKTRANQEPAPPDSKALHLLRDAAEKMCLTARAFENSLKVAATIARLDGAKVVGRIHVAEALSYLSRHSEKAAAA